jgi:uncharacterized protein involved in exopolysaccharide biosynthesis
MKIERYPDNLNLVPLFAALRSRVSWITAVTLFCTALSVAGSFLLPRKYKSESQLTIYTKYFQNPLVRELIADQYDSAEMRLQREALIRQALDEEFLDQVGEKKGFYKGAPGTPERSAERELLRNRFEIFALNGTSFQIDFIASDRFLAKEVNTLAVTRVMKTLVEQRRKTLANARDAVRGRLESIALEQSHSVDPMVSTRPELLQRELGRAEEEMAGLLSRYSPLHPQVLRLRARVEWLRSWLAHRAPGGNVAEDADSQLSFPEPKTLVGGELEAPTREVYQELLKKLNYLNIALEMEKPEVVSYFGIIEAPSLPGAAFSPKRIEFLVFGLAGGLLLALFSVLLQEYLKFLAPTPEKDAIGWGAPFLGALPVLRPQAAEVVDGEPSKKSPERDHAPRWN